MFLKQLFLFVCGLSFGLLSSAGVFTVLASVGLIPRFAGKMHVAKKIFVMEEAVIFGTLAGGIGSLYSDKLKVGELLLQSRMFGEGSQIVVQVAGTVFLLIFGLFSGMFVGCLAFAIAEMLDSIPIFARRAGLRHGLGVAISAAAAGKLLGSLLYFAKGIFLTGM